MAAIAGSMVDCRVCVFQDLNNSVAYCKGPIITRGGEIYRRPNSREDYQERVRNGCYCRWSYKCRFLYTHFNMNMINQAGRSCLHVCVFRRPALLT